MRHQDVERYLTMYRRNVLTTALCYVKNPSDADDILQDVFFGLYKYDGSFNDDEHVKAWLIRCTVNRCRNLLGSHWYKASVPLDNAREQVHIDSYGESAAELLQRIGKNNRIALYLHCYEGYSVSETAKILGISENAVSSRLRRGREQLRKLLDEERKEYGY